MKIVSNGAVLNVPISSMRGPAGPDGNPIGTVISYMGKTAPKDYLICDGGLYNRADFPDLASFFQVQFGASNYFGGDGETTIAVPDLQSPNANVLSCIKAKESDLAEDIYSLEEQVVGRWLDGKPVYERTVIVTIACPAINTVAKVINLATYSVDTLVWFDAYVVPLWNSSMGLVKGSYGTEFTYNEKWLNVKQNITNDSSNKQLSIRFVLRYTKTTDQPTNDVSVLYIQPSAIATTSYDFYQDYDKEVS